MSLYLRNSVKLSIAFLVLFAHLSFTANCRAGELTGKASLTWNLNPETNIAGYRVFYGTSSGKLSQSQTVSSNVSSSSISGLETGVTYYFSVLAYNTSGLEGPTSDEVSFFVEMPSVPEISVERSPSVILTTGQNNTLFGEVRTGTIGGATEFVVRNVGTASLTGLKMEIDGPDHADFAIQAELPYIPVLTSNAAFNANLSAWNTSGNLRIIRDTASPGSGNVVDFNYANTTPNGSISQNFTTIPGTTYRLTFDIGIFSYNSNPQAIQITATGVNTVLADTVTVIGKGNITAEWDSRSFNFIADSATTQLILTDVSPSSDGADLRIDNVRVIDAVVAGVQPVDITLEPGESSRFLVAFSPSSAGVKTAYLHVYSNDADENPFDLTLSGAGAKQPEPPTHPEIEIQRSVGTHLVNGAAAISFQDTLLTSSADTETLLITNTGTADLANLSVSIAGDNPSQFSTDLLAVSVLAPGESISFIICFKPTSVGSKNAILQISSNDEDEPAFRVTLAGNGAVPPPILTPKISVERANGVNLINRESIGFGDILLGAASITETLTIQNTGTAQLTNIAITLVGSHAAEFILGTASINSLAPGASTSCSLIFRPTTSGTRNVTVRIASNDADENPFEINLNGNGIAVPEINVEKSNGDALVDASSSIQFTNVILGSTSAVEAITLRNSGTATLANIVTSISGSHAADFIFESPLVSSLPPDSNSIFKIAFKPTSSGTRNAVLRIASNDADENPFEINLIGNGIPVPEIALFRADGSPISDRSNLLSFGSVNLGSVSAVETITIRNTGSAILTELAVTAKNNSDADFIISSLKTTALAPGESVSFSVSFNPQSTGTRSGVLLLTSNDPNFSVLSVLLSGTGHAFPVLELEQLDGTRLESGSTLPDFGSVLVGNSSMPLTLRITNNGTATLSGLSISSTGTNGSDFSITQPTFTTLAPKAAVLFSVTFRPGSDGYKSAVLRISSSGSSTPPHEINVIGSAITIPSIALFDSEGTELTAGAVIVNFGNLDVLASPKMRTFSIKNTGTTTLVGVRLLKEGPNVSDFSILANGLTSIAPGASVDFTISFDSTSVGNRSAAIRILSNAGYDIIQPVTGKGLASPEIKIEVADKNLRSGDSFINFGTSQISTRSETRTFTISNIGSANLEKISLVKNGNDSSDFIVTALKTNSLAPGKSTTFNVSFKASETGNRWANMYIASNDFDEKPFAIGLSGRGISRSDFNQSSARSLATLVRETPRAEIGVELIGGKKYRTLTIHKSIATVVHSRDIEVSSDLILWSSGSLHTTVVRDNSSVLTVRDNTPINRDTKRYIRIRP